MQHRTIVLKVPVIVFTLAVFALAQAGRKPPPADPPRKANESQTTKPEGVPTSGQQESEAVKLGTTLVTAPVIASDRNGLYIPDMRKEEFTIFEDGIKQEMVFFATIKEPFQVVLLLDTSASTQEKLGQIQRAAIAFVEQLQSADRVKVISFDDDIRDLNDFTSDREILRGAIERTRPGKGTRLYDAFRLALQNLRYEQGRKAIVLFTDGVDWHSNSTTAVDNRRELEETGVIVYPIQYDTRAETEALVRQQQQRGQLPDLGVIFGGPSRDPTRTPPTAPGGDRIPDGRAEKTDPYALPIPPIIVPLPRRDPYPGGGRDPNSRYPDERYPDNRYPDPRNPGGGRFPDGPFPDTRSPNPGSTGRRGDSTSVLLDNLYTEADRYLNQLATTSGGKVHRADTLISLPAAFAQIAAELRTQYALGYYPSNAARDGSYRKIQVQTSRKDAVIRARPGYRAAGNKR
ncbi:MAG TPA: VWA domain-containing protein [Blastocatellia bacterium]|nr:VWA domain-containing protein [Blastocatellia bacterium]